MRRRLLAYSCLVLLLVPLLSACAPRSEQQPNSDLRLYQILPVPRKSPLAAKAGEGEAIALINAGEVAHTISGWEVATNAGRVELPKLTMEPGEILYLANNAAYFEQYWHFPPDFEYGTDADAAVPDLKGLDGTVPLLNDYGDEVRLLDEDGNVVDILSYGEILNHSQGWTGFPVQLVESPAVPMANQVLTRIGSLEGLGPEARAELWSGDRPDEPGRVYYPGQSDLPVSQVEGEAVFVLVPERPGAYVAALLANAVDSIRLVGPQFSSEVLTEALIAADERGVRVQVAVDRQPGEAALSIAERRIHQRLDEAGVEVLYAYQWDGPDSARYSILHSSYILIDGETVVISSAPWTDDVFGTAPGCGESRAWVAAIVGNREMAGLVRAVWDADFGQPYPDVRRYDPAQDAPPALRVESAPDAEASRCVASSRASAGGLEASVSDAWTDGDWQDVAGAGVDGAWSGAAGAAPDGDRADETGAGSAGAGSDGARTGADGAWTDVGADGTRTGSTGAEANVRRVWGTAKVTRLAFPENALNRKEGFLGILRGAQRELLISGLYIDLGWGDSTGGANPASRPNPYVTELVAAARRGVSVRVLLDARTAAAQSERGSGSVVDYLNNLAAWEGLDLEARVINLPEDGRYLATGLVVDDAVIIGSMNGSENSFRRARELALMFADLPSFTAEFRERFQQDWEASQLSDF